MDNLILKMVVAGVLFGIWPLLMNKSGLTGVTSAFIYSIFILLFMLPIVMKEGIIMTGANWWFIIVATFCGSMGLLVFNGALAKTTPEGVSRLIFIMLIVQMAIPAIYYLIVNGQVTLKMGMGFIAAAIAAILLT